MRKVRSVNCLVVLIVVCSTGPVSFGEVLELSGLKRSTVWDCLSSLKREGLVEVKKALTALGPRTVASCTEEGLSAVEELLRLLKNARHSAEAKL